MANLVSSPCTTNILCGCLAFAFPAVPHFNNRYLHVTCPTSRTSIATSTAPSTGGPIGDAGKMPAPLFQGGLRGILHIFRLEKLL